MLRKSVYFLFGVLLIALVHSWSTRPQHTGPDTDHFDGTTFISPSYEQKSAGDLLKWRLNANPGPWQTHPLASNLSLPIAQSEQLRITFINHSTVLIQVGGFNLLTDPIWSKRTGPWGRLGPSRYRPPGIQIDDLPHIHAVLISHSHFDHMDLPTLAHLAEVFDPVFIVGLANAQNLAKVNLTNIVELDWWQTHALSPQISIRATPAEHWSKRALFDTNQTLWMGFSIIEGERHRVFFAGDTGFGPHFDEVYRRIGACDVALLPIGAYLPRWFMQANHISPAEALQAAAALHSDVMIPIHFGTFALGDEGQDQPLTDLLAARAKFPKQKIRVLDNGQFTELNSR